jgi:hypothetical protein
MAGYLEINGEDLARKIRLGRNSGKFLAERSSIGVRDSRLHFI